MASSPTIEKSNEKPETATPETQTPVAPDATPPVAPKKKKPVVAIIIGLTLLAIIGAYAYSVFSFNSTHASTDDAYIDASNTAVSAQVSGTVYKVLVHDDQLVKKGQLLAVIDPRPFQTQVEQAKANYDAAVAAAQSAGIGVNLTQQNGNAQIQQANGIVSQSQSGISTAISDVAKSEAGISSANATISASKAGIIAAQSGLTNAESNYTKAKAAVAAARAGIQSAQAGVNVATANVASAQANNNYAQNEATRFENLVKQGAVSQEQADVKVTAATSAAAALEAARQQQLSANAMLAQARANLISAQGGVSSAQSQIAEARAQISVANSQLASSKAGYRASLAQTAAANEEVSAAKAKNAQALGQLAQAQTAPTQVSSSQSGKVEALAKVEQAEAQLKQAQLNLSFTKIYAPMNGRVTNKNCDVGQLITPNAPLMAIVDNAGAYIWANYKETQMSGIVPGQPVSITVDAIPGVTFTGHVQSIQAGTGSTFTLIPPDNASGNFTKVVQRIPVKITFDPNQKDTNQLITGQSVAAITTLKKN